MPGSNKKFRSLDFDEKYLLTKCNWSQPSNTPAVLYLGGGDGMAEIE
jgi:hypothetical protein